MRQLAEAASSFGAYTAGVVTSLENLERRAGRFACVALLEGEGHYVCIYDLDRSSVFLVDPPRERVVSRGAFSKLWSGRALLLSDRPLAATARCAAWVLPTALVSAVVVLTLGLWAAWIRRRG